MGGLVNITLVVVDPAENKKEVPHAKSHRK